MKTLQQVRFPWKYSNWKLFCQAIKTAQKWDNTQLLLFWKCQYAFDSFSVREATIRFREWCGIGYMGEFRWMSPANFPEKSNLIAWPIASGTNTDFNWKTFVPQVTKQELNFAIATFILLPLLIFCSVNFLVQTRCWIRRIGESAGCTLVSAKLCLGTW